jgi:hypothetical protein
VDTYCSVPLPKPFPEDQDLARKEVAYRAAIGITTQGTKSQNNTVRSLQALVDFQSEEPNSGSYFKAVIMLSIIVQDISSLLYSAATIIRPSEEIQLQVIHLNQRLDQWTSLLPREFNFQISDMQSDTIFVQERKILGFQLCSARMLLTRPYLSGKRQLHQEHEEAGFSNSMGNICIQSAKAVVDLLPDILSARFIYDQGPWWCIVHYMMQAVAVLLLGLSHPFSMSYTKTTIVQCIGKIIQHLQFMQDSIAQRAFKVALELFDTVTRRGLSDVSG